jgi:NADPH:quinone reductase-like Zn-dependent oxidoreductase
MRAILLKGHGGFEQLEYRTDVPAPSPAPGEVLIQILAAGVNNTDVNTRIGWYSKSVATETATAGRAATSRAEDSAWTGATVKFPRIQGADACGRIVAVGGGVDAARIGERVIVFPVISAGIAASHGDARYFGSDTDGAFADFATVPAVNACKIRSDLTDIELASFPCSYGAAENMLTRARVAAGDLVVVTGASGGVGSAAVQLAKRRGAQVIAIADRSKAASVQSLGARKVLERDANLVAELGKESVDVVVDVVGGPHFPQLVDVLKRSGRYAAAGAIAGPIVRLDLRTLYLKDLSLLGCTLLEFDVFTNLIGYIERREIRPLIAATYSMSEVVAAQRAFLSKLHVGKIVMTP